MKNQKNSYLKATFRSFLIVLGIGLITLGAFEWQQDIDPTWRTKIYGTSFILLGLTSIIYGVREIPSELVGKLLQTAIEIHDRQLDRAAVWKAYIPIVVAITAGAFTIFGIVLKSYLSANGT